MAKTKEKPIKVVFDSPKDLIFKLGAEAISLFGDYKWEQMKPAYFNKQPTDWKAKVGETLKPYLNIENISLFIQDKYLSDIKSAINKGTANLDKDYHLQIEPIPNDVAINLCYRDAEGNLQLIKTYYLSGITKGVITDLLINTFFKNGNIQPGALERPTE